jgi:hypothetical protein
MQPDGRIKVIARRPNIRSIDRHSECWKLDHSGVMSWWGQPGDVRLCPHGKVQIRTEVGPNSRVAGPGTDWWRDLSPFWNPVLYRRARKALG